MSRISSKDIDVFAHREHEHAQAHGPRSRLVTIKQSQAEQRQARLTPFNSSPAPQLAPLHLVEHLAVSRRLPSPNARNAAKPTLNLRGRSEIPLLVSTPSTASSSTPSSETTAASARSAAS